MVTVLFTQPYCNVYMYKVVTKKIECANHICKCLSLEKCVDENPKYKGKGGLTLKMRKKLACAARSAMKARSQDADVKKNIKLLQQDLLNGPMHCFGYHHKCGPDFCKHQKGIWNPNLNLILNLKPHNRYSLMDSPLSSGSFFSSFQHPPATLNDTTLQYPAQCI